DPEDLHVETVDLTADLRDSRSHVEQTPAGLGGLGAMSGQGARHGETENGSGDLVGQLCDFCANHHYVPYCAHPDHPGAARFFESEPVVRPLYQGGRLIYAADHSLQPQRKPSPLRLREEAAQLALTAVRLDREPARM